MFLWKKFGPCLQDIHILSHVPPPSFRHSSPPEPRKPTSLVLFKTAQGIPSTDAFLLSNSSFFQWKLWGQFKNSYLAKKSWSKREFIETSKLQSEAVCNHRQLPDFSHGSWKVWKVKAFVLHLLWIPESEVNKNPLETTSKNVTILMGLLGKGLLSPASYLRSPAKKKLAIWSCPSCPIQWFHSSQQCRPGTLNDTCGTRVFCIKTKKSVARKKGKVTQQLSIWIFIWCWIPFFDFESWIPFLIWCPFFGFELEIPFFDVTCSWAVGKPTHEVEVYKDLQKSQLWTPSCF